VLVELDNCIDRVRRHETPFGEQRLERASPELDGGGGAWMVMVVAHSGSR
jgi:hypothetical protein